MTENLYLPRHFVISEKLEDYEVLCDIGSGQFGVVQKVKFRPDPRGRPLVWKKINYQRQSEKEKQLLASEAQLLSTLQHPNVVRYVGRINDKENNCLYLLMEYCDGGDLAGYLDHTVRKGHFLAEELIEGWFRQLVNALHYCHTRAEGKVLHRDLKPQNILLCGPQRSRVKLADFGLAKMLGPGQVMTQTHVGTPFYMSPEVLARQEYNEKSDVWSLGCLLYEMMTGRSPFAAAANFTELSGLVKSNRIRSVSRNYTDELNAVTVKMLCDDMRQRPSTTDLKNSLVYRYAELAAVAVRPPNEAMQLKAELELLKKDKENLRRELDYANEVNGNKLRICQYALEKARNEFTFLEDYILFQQESDAAIRQSLKMVGTKLRGGSRRRSSSARPPISASGAIG